MAGRATRRYFSAESLAKLKREEKAVELLKEKDLAFDHGYVYRFEE